MKKRYSLIDYNLYKKVVGELPENATLTVDRTELPVFYNSLYEYPLKITNEQDCVNPPFDLLNDCIVLPNVYSSYYGAFTDVVLNSFSEVCSENNFGSLQNFAGDVATFVCVNFNGEGITYNFLQEIEDQSYKVTVKGYGFSSDFSKEYNTLAVDLSVIVYNNFLNLITKHREEFLILDKKAQLFSNLTFSNINDLEKIVFSEDTKTNEFESADTPEQPLTSLDNFANLKQKGKETKTHEKSLSKILEEFKNGLFGLLYKILPEIIIFREKDENENAF